MNTKLGKITHYYPKIGVAVVDLVDSLHQGDEITISGSTSFSQTVSSMQIEHEAQEQVKKGQTIGLKVDQPVKPGDEITKSLP